MRPEACDMDEAVVVAALLRGSPEVARSLTRLHCWPSDSFAVAYDELARQGQLHRLLLLAQQPVLLLEHVLSCTTGDSSDTARLRLVALVTAVAGRPAENNILFPTTLSGLISSQGQHVLCSYSSTRRFVILVSTCQPKEV